MADGWITIGTKIDNDKFDKQLRDIDKKIANEEKNTKLKLEAKIEAENELKRQQELVFQLEKQYAKAAEQAEKLQNIMSKKQQGLSLTPQEFMDLSDYEEVIKNEEYSLSLIEPYILHFTGEKPWNNPNLPYAEAFFKYARSSIFYEEVLYKATERKIQDFTKDHLKYYHPNGLNKIFSIKNKYSNGKKEKFITIFGFTFVK